MPVHSSTHRHSGKVKSKSHGGADDATKLKPQLVVAPVEEESSIPSPHHYLMPELPNAQGELFVECSVFLYSVLALFLQYLNLYKTFWWLPNSHTHHSMKFYLVDPFLLSVIGLILGRRVTFCFLRRVTFDIPGLQVPYYFRIIEWLLKLCMLTVVMTSFMFSMTRVVVTYSWISILFLFYPLLIFCLMFARKLSIAFKECSGKNNFVALFALFSFGTEHSPQLAAGQGHACSQSPCHIREEVEILYGDFLGRFWQSFFASVSVAYYAIFVACCFTPGTLYIDWWWVTEMILGVFLTTWIVQLAYVLPLQYCDLLHRSASHLGRWQKLDSARSASQQLLVPNQISWSESDLWTDGHIVKHGRSLYKGEGVSIAAEPGNADHSRFYFLFNDPMRVINSLCVMNGYVIVVQFVLLVHSSDWQHIITLVFYMFTNYITMFKLFKDKIIMGRIYSPAFVSEKLN